MSFRLVPKSVTLNVTA